MDKEKVKQLRQETDISFQKCKEALQESNDNLEQAKEILKKEGQKMAEQKSQRETNQGIVESYIHANKRVGAMIKLSCETDFVARSDEFQKLAHELCMQVAAGEPKYLRSDDISEERLEEEKKIYEEQVEDSEKPEDIKKEIVEGKLKKYKEENCLMTQKWIRDNDKTIKEVIDEYIAKIGENIEVKEFERFEV